MAVKQQVAVIDYGMGNLHSAASALQHVAPEADVLVSADPQLIANADRVVFPGVGAIRDCMAEINRLGIGDIVRRAIEEKPVLAICIGMQALMERSEENDGVDCLGILEGDVRFFGHDLHDGNTGERLKVPHMGWSPVRQTVDHHLWQGIEDNTRFYFVHSYFVHAKSRDLVYGQCNYGIDFDAVLNKGNLFAAQFHPEKSHTAGLQLLANFMSWNGEQ